MIGAHASGSALARAGRPRTGGGRVARRVALRVLPIAIALAGAWAGWTLLSAPRLQVTPEAAQVWMLALDERIRKRTQARYEGPPVLRFYQRVAWSDTAEGAGPGADRVQQVRGVLLEPAASRYQQKLLQDIGARILALDHEVCHIQDVHAYRDTLWVIVGIHADLSSRYYHQHRAVAVLQLLQRRLF